MQCYLTRGGRPVVVKQLSPELTDEEAIELCRLVFEKCLQYLDSRQYIDDFEVWKHARKVYHHSRDGAVVLPLKETGERVRSRLPSAEDDRRNCPSSSIP